MASKLAAVIDDKHPLVKTEPADVSLFCSKYRDLSAAGRALVWQTMLERMAGQESGYQAAEPYWETGQGQYSIGLLQLSLSDERGYQCGFKTEVDVTDPDRNLP